MSYKKLGIRHEVAGRHAGGLLDAKPLFAAYNYADKFPRAKRGARAAGHRFEAKVVKALEQKYPSFTTSLAFQFKTEYAEKNICIVDGLLALDDEVVVVEVKLRHTVDAWFQLRKLYQPVLKKALNKPIRALEICSVYEPQARFPEPFLIVTNIEEFIRSRCDLGVLIWPR